MINKTPDEFYDWVFDNKEKININLLNDQFPMNHLINEINEIIDGPDNKLCSYFSLIGNLPLLKYCHKKCSKYILEDGDKLVCCSHT